MVLGFAGLTLRERLRRLYSFWRMNERPMPAIVRSAQAISPG